MSVVSKAGTLGTISFQPLTGYSRSTSLFFFSPQQWFQQMSVKMTGTERDRDLSWGSFAALLFSGWLILTGSIFDLLFGRLWWSQWRQQLGQVRVGHALLASAVKHRALSLQLQVSAADCGFGIFCPCCQALHPRRVGLDSQAEGWPSCCCLCPGPSLQQRERAGQGMEGRSNTKGWGSTERSC